MEYYEFVLNRYEGSKAITGKLIPEMSYFGIELGGIRFGKSSSTYKADRRSNRIYKGMKSISHMNEEQAEYLYNFYYEHGFDKEGMNSFLKDSIFDLPKLFAMFLEDGIVKKNVMRNIIKLGFFEEIAPRHIALLLWEAMTDSKLDLTAYPEFLPKEVIEEKMNKKTGVVTRTAKVIKTPLVYDRKHKDATKSVRVNNIQKFYQHLLENPPLENTIGQIILDEVELLGYGDTTLKDSEDEFVVIDILNIQYTPKLLLYSLSDGSTTIMKISKQRFWDDMGYPIIYKGDHIKVLETEEQEGWMKSEDGWLRNPYKTEIHFIAGRLISRCSKEISKTEDGAE